jgi:hypothetical protein
MLHRGQSHQSTGAEACGVLAGLGGGKESAREEESGLSTALTRRGLSEVLFSWHCARRGQARQ